MTIRNLIKVKLINSKKPTLNTWALGRVAKQRHQLN